MQLNSPLMKAEELLRHPSYQENKYHQALELLSQILEVVDTKNEVIEAQEVEIESLYRKLEGRLI